MTLAICVLAACASPQSAENATETNEAEAATRSAGSRGPGKTLRAVEPSDNKHALLIAIGDYPVSSGWSDINSKNDLPLLRAALQRQGFPKSQTVELVDAEADAAGIHKAMDALLERVEPGDVVAIHYSGHGHQITDDDSPAEEIDGYDEVLVAHGAPLDPPKGYKGEKHVRDDDIGVFLGKLRKELGESGHVLVSIDACHSGSGTRSELKARGTPTGPIGDPAAVEETKQEVEGGGMFEAARSRGNDAAIAPLVVMSAARDDQLAMEVQTDDGTPVGSLTYALTTALSQTSQQVSYAALFNEVERLLTSKVEGQRPQLEGDRNALVFSGQTVQLPDYYTVEAVEDGEVIVEAGELVGLRPGTQLAFYPPDVRLNDETKPLARGKVSAAGPTWATVPLEDDAPDLSKSWVVVEAYGFGDMRIRVAIDPSIDKADGLEAFLDETTFLTHVAMGAELTFFANDDGTVELNTADDRLTVAGPFDPTDSFNEQLREDASGYARRKLLTDLTLTDPEVDVALEVVPIQHKMRAGRCKVLEELPRGDFVDAGGRVIMPVGSAYRVRMQNRSKVPAYVTLLGISADGSVAQIYPAASAGREHNRIQPNRKSFDFDACITASPPVGIDRFKIIATREPVNFGSVVRSGGQSTRGGDASPLEMLLSDRFLATSGDEDDQKSLKTRGIQSTVVAPRAGSTATVSVEVVDK
ncbi:MAG: caspase family protein [Myxococcota bacterium]